MIRKLRDELREIREPLMDADASARADVAAGVARDVGELRFVTAASGPMERDFDPIEDPDHQTLSNTLAELRPLAQELRQEVRRNEETVASLPAHPLLWYVVIGVAIPVELLCGLQLFQTMGVVSRYRLPAAFGLMTATFTIVWLVRSTAASVEDTTGWRRLLAWVRVVAAALAAVAVALCLGFARVDPVGSSGLPAAVRVSRLTLLILITVGPAVAFKYAVDRLREASKPRRELSAHRRELKEVEREQASVTKEIAAVRQRAADWRKQAATQGARYQAAYDRASGTRRN